MYRFLIKWRNVNIVVYGNLIVKCNLERSLTTRHARFVRAYSRQSPDRANSCTWRFCPDFRPTCLQVNSPSHHTSNLDVNISTLPPLFFFFYSLRFSDVSFSLLALSTLSYFLLLLLSSSPIKCPKSGRSPSGL